MRNFIFYTAKGFPSCHASNLTELPDGRLAAVWFGGTQEACPDTAIWGSVLEDGKWSAPKLYVKHALVAHWNPVLYIDQKKRINLYFKIGKTPETWATFYTSTKDIHGKWSQPNSFSEPLRGPVRSKIITLSNGTIVAGSSEETIFMAAPRIVIWKSFMEYSTNDGKKWQRCADIVLDRKRYGEYGGLIQPALWESSPGNVHAFFRSTLGIIFRSDSSDYGKTWSPAEPEMLPNNNSAVDIAKTEDGTLVLIYNPVQGNWVARTPISLIFSSGEGRVWKEPVDVEIGRGSFSYPSIIPVKDGVAYTYTWNRARIAFDRIQVQTSDSGAINHNVNTANAEKDYAWIEATRRMSMS